MASSKKPGGKQGGKHVCGPCAVLRKEVVFRAGHACPCNKSEFEAKKNEVWRPAKAVHKGKFDCVFWIKWLYTAKPNTFVFKGDTWAWFEPFT